MNILNDGGQYYFFNSVTIDKNLAVKNYTFNFDAKKGNCWLEDAEPFKVPEKIYDVNSKLRNLVKSSFNHYDKNMGILLTGNKGQGKSLTSKLICQEAGIPIIMINKSIPKNVDFINFFSQIKQNYCLFVDEFEKLFSNHDDPDFHEQESFLSFMDGASSISNKVMFLMTSNSSVNEFLINRPSRIKFLQEYEELPEELFHMIVDDKLKNKEFKSNLEENISLINMNIDLLISIVDDINLFNEPFSNFKELYNYKFESYRYEMIRIVDGVEKFYAYFNTHKKIKHDTTYINNSKVSEILKYSKDEITFTAVEWDEDDHGNEIQKEHTYKIKPTINSALMSKVF